MKRGRQLCYTILLFNPARQLHVRPTIYGCDVALSTQHTDHRNMLHSGWLFSWWSCEVFVLSRIMGRIQLLSKARKVCCNLKMGKKWCYMLKIQSCPSLLFSKSLLPVSSPLWVVVVVVDSSPKLLVYLSNRRAWTHQNTTGDKYKINRMLVLLVKVMAIQS